MRLLLPHAILVWAAMLVWAFGAFGLRWKYDALLLGLALLALNYLIGL